MTVSKEYILTQTGRRYTVVTNAPANNNTAIVPAGNDTETDERSRRRQPGSLTGQVIQEVTSGSLNALLTAVANRALVGSGVMPDNEATLADYQSRPEGPLRRVAWVARKPVRRLVAAAWGGEKGARQREKMTRGQIVKELEQTILGAREAGSDPYNLWELARRLFGEDNFGALDELWGVAQQRSGERTHEERRLASECVASGTWTSGDGEWIDRRLAAEKSEIILGAGRTVVERDLCNYLRRIISNPNIVLPDENEAERRRLKRELKVLTNLEDRIRQDGNRRKKRSLNKAITRVEKRLRELEEQEVEREDWQGVPVFGVTTAEKFLAMILGAAVPRGNIQTLVGPSVAMITRGGGVTVRHGAEVDTVSGDLEKVIPDTDIAPAFENLAKIATRRLNVPWVSRWARNIAVGKGREGKLLDPGVLMLTREGAVEPTIIPVLSVGRAMETIQQLIVTRNEAIELINGLEAKSPQVRLGDDGFRAYELGRIKGDMVGMPRRGEIADEAALVRERLQKEEDGRILRKFGWGDKPEDIHSKVAAYAKSNQTAFEAEVTRRAQGMGMKTDEVEKLKSALWRKIS